MDKMSSEGKSAESKNTIIFGSAEKGGYDHPVLCFCVRITCHRTYYTNHCHQSLCAEHATCHVPEPLSNLAKNDELSQKSTFNFLSKQSQCELLYNKEATGNG